jgi:hypothetical protein
MNNDEKILKALSDLQTGQNALHADVTAIKDVQQKQGKRLENVEAGQNTLDLKVEAIHAYQKQTHDEIMEHLIDSNEVAGKAQRTLEEQVEQIKKHVGLPPLK